MTLGVVQADVLVCAKGGGGLLKERMALVADLWAAGLRAEMMQQAAPSLTAQYDYAHARHIPWLLIIQAATLSAADTVKVPSPSPVDASSHPQYCWPITRCHDVSSSSQLGCPAGQCPFLPSPWLLAFRQPLYLLPMLSSLVYLKSHVSTNARCR